MIKIKIIPTFWNTSQRLFYSYKTEKIICCYPFNLDPIQKACVIEKFIENIIKIKNKLQLWIWLFI